MATSMIHADDASGYEISYRELSEPSRAAVVLATRRRISGERRLATQARYRRRSGAASRFSGINRRRHRVF